MNKTLLMLLRTFIPLFFLGASPLFAALSWETDLDAALKKAREEKKPVMVEFTGSTWCGPCMKMKKDVLDTEDFEKKAGGRYILVELDLPRQRGSSPQEMRNRQWEKKLNVEGVPTIVLFDESGMPYAKSAGLIENAKKMGEVLDMWERNREFRDASFREANGLKDGKRAGALVRAFSVLPGDLIESHYSGRVEELKLCDPEDKTGFFQARRLDELKKSQMQEFASIMGQRGGASILRPVTDVQFEGKTMSRQDALKAFAARESTLPELKQRAMVQYDFSPNYMSGDVDKMLESLERIRLVDPDSPMGKWSEGMKGVVKESAKKSSGKSGAVRVTVES